MKNKKILIIAVLMIFTLLSSNCTYASMADYTDEDAERDAQKMIQEHKENFDSTKSDNNFLKELNVKGKTISPSFDRQTIEYSVKVSSSTNEIEITASPEDSRATVKGTGKIEIKDVSDCKVEVISESGTTRTYFIKIIKENEEKVENTNEKKEDVSDSVIEDENIIITSNIIKEENLAQELKDEKKINKYAIGSIIGVLVIICLIIVLKIKNKE